MNFFKSALRVLDLNLKLILTVGLKSLIKFRKLHILKLLLKCKCLIINLFVGIIFVYNIFYNKPTVKLSKKSRTLINFILMHLTEHCS